MRLPEVQKMPVFRRICLMLPCLSLASSQRVVCWARGTHTGHLGGCWLDSPFFYGKKTGCTPALAGQPVFLTKKKRDVKPIFKKNGLLRVNSPFSLKKIFLCWTHHHHHVILRAGKMQGPTQYGG